jgi:glycosyltransferase involved in cell wall biosynthesis
VTDRLLCISQSFAPQTTPTGIRAGKLVERLAENWEVELLTESAATQSSDRVVVEHVAAHRPRGLLATLRRAHLDKLLELLVWPDESIFWVLPTIVAGRRIVKRRRPRAIVVFMMPYSAGLAGIVLARLAGLPLILNLDDSPTCSDMHPQFPSRLHYWLARALENLYVRRADAIVYVSQTNLELVAARQPVETRAKLHLVRYGADETQPHPTRSDDQRFEIVYVGAMSGWWTLISQRAPASAFKRIYDAWMRLGRLTITQLDPRTASPAIVGEALKRVLAEHPEWEGRVGMTVYDNSYPREVIGRALAAAEVDQVVAVDDPVAHERVAEILGAADLLFLTLPRRVDGSRGGRISAKTYEYLMTDRPILAALPAGENWDYLAGKPGVWLTEPDDVEAQRAVIADLAAAKFAGRPRRFARERERAEISYAARAEQFEAVIRAGIERSQRDSVAEAR